MAKLLTPILSLGALLRDVARDDFLAGTHSAKLRELATALEDAEVADIGHLKTLLTWARLWRDEHLAK